MQKLSYKIEILAPMLITAGFMVHLINYSRHILLGLSDVAELITWPVDFCMFVLMLYCAFVMIFRWKSIQSTFDHSKTWRRVAYWIVTVYITISIPIHIVFLATGDPSFLQGFPPAFSLGILPIYALMITFFLTLKRVTDDVA